MRELTPEGAWAKVEGRVKTAHPLAGGLLLAEPSRGIGEPDPGANTRVPGATPRKESRIPEMGRRVNELAGREEICKGEIFTSEGGLAGIRSLVGGVPPLKRERDDARSSNSYIAGDDAVLPGGSPGA